MNQIEEASSLKIKEARAFLGLSQTKLGESLGVSLRTVQNWESEVNPIPLGQLKLINNLIKEKKQAYINKNGNSFTQTTDGQVIIEVPIFPMEAYAKYLDEWTSDAQFFEEYEKITFAVDKIGNKDKEGYVFPFLNGTNSELEQKKKIALVINLTNEYMNRIGKKLGIEINLTTYVARHSFATILARNNVPTLFISQSLGHSSIKTTENYLGAFEKEQTEDFLKNLL